MSIAPHALRVWWARHDVKDKVITLLGVCIVVYALFASSAAWLNSKASYTQAQTNATAQADNHSASVKKTNIVIGLQRTNNKLLTENNKLEAANVYLATENHQLLTQHSNDLAATNAAVSQVLAEQQNFDRIIAELPALGTEITAGQGGLESTLSSIESNQAAFAQVLRAICAANHVSCAGLPGG